MTKLNPIFFILFFLAFTSCAKKVPTFREGSSSEGYASWYGDQFNGRKTASGETYNMHKFTAAHREAPFGTLVRVTNVETDRSTVVRINDRGPFVRGRIIDLSRAAAKELGMLGTGTARVHLAFLGKGEIPHPPSISPPPVSNPPSSSPPSTPPPTAPTAAPPTFQEPTAEAPQNLSPPAETTFFIQIGSFKSFLNAQNFKEEFDQFHSDAKSQIVKQEGFFRVWLGPFDKEEVAQKVEASVKNEGKKTVLLRR